jgi:hypothetical protein
MHPVPLAPYLHMNLAKVSRGFQNPHGSVSAKDASTARPVCNLLKVHVNYEEIA